MGFEGANVLFDTWVHPLVMGLEEHLLTMFREGFRILRCGRGPATLAMRQHRPPMLRRLPNKADTGAG